MKEIVCCGTGRMVEMAGEERGRDTNCYALGLLTRERDGTVKIYSHVCEGCLDVFFLFFFSDLFSTYHSHVFMC